MAEKTVACSCCSTAYPMESHHSCEGRDLCPTCWDEHTVRCDFCEEHIWLRQHVGDTYITLCRSCYDSHYTSCSQCGRIVHQDDARYLSDDDDDPPLPQLL